MVRRKDQSYGGRHVAGEFGDLFLLSDGVTPLFTADKADCFPNADIAAAAWERARLSTWRHEHRETVWPPHGAQVYDGITCRSSMGGQTRERLESDLEALAEHRRQRPDLAELLEAEYGEYEQALQLLIGLAIKHHDVWRPKLVTRNDGTLAMQGPDLSDTVREITTRQALRGAA